MKARWILAFGAAASVAILGARVWLHQSTAPAAPAAGHVAEALPGQPRSLQIGDTAPDARLVDQEGREFHLADFRGETLVLAFIYTHCNVTSMCPTTTNKMVRAQGLVRERGIPDVTFLLVSFDTERDLPERLRTYAATHDTGDVLLATGTPEEIEPLARAFNTYYRSDIPGVFEHNVVISVIDRAGRLRDDLFGTAWAPEELAAVIESLDGA
jgi:protein SCO1/2